MANSTAFTSGRDLPSVAENVELLTGQRGNKLDKAVTYRDLESLGVATLSRIGSSYSAKANPVLTTTASVVDTPTKPKNVQANGAFNTILIDWDEPDYRGHEYAEVFRAEVDNLSVAVNIGTTSARMYSDPIGGDAKVYYWVRFVNANNVPGPFNASAGTYAETAVDVQQLLDSLQGQIEESQLSTALTSKIGIIDTNSTSIQQITVDLSSLSDRQAQAEAILKSAQDLLGQTTIDVSLLHDQLSQQVQKYGSEVKNLTDAILTVNPATGEITIDAVNVVRSELQSSISEVSQRVSSVEGTLTQKASSVDVNLQSQRISTIETQMDVLNSELISQVTRAEFTTTTEDVTQLTTRMNAAEGSITSKAAQQTVDGISTRLSTAETTLSTVNTTVQSQAQQISNIQSGYQSADSANTAAITALSQTVADENSATAQQLSSIGSSVDSLMSSVSQLQQTSTGSTESMASIYDQLKAKADISALAAANAALSDDESSRKTRESEASIRTDLTVLANDREALAQSVSELSASFESEKADLSAQIATEQIARANADSSLSSRIDTVQATANGLTSSVQTQSQAISTLQNGAQAMWTTKAQVGNITAGIGLMADSNGKSQVMISASQLFMFDPNGAAPTRSIFAVSNGQVVMQKAVIEAATIETVTAMSLTADYVRAGVSITSPAINGGTLAIGSGDNSCFMEGGSIGIGKGGPYGGWGWGWHTIIYADGGLYTDRLHASSGDFTGYVHATSGYFENVTINENCDVRGTIYANKIVGDVVASKLASKSTTYTISASPKTRVLTANVYISSTMHVSPYNSGSASADAQLYLDGVRVGSKSIVGPILATASNSGTATASGVVGFHATVSANATHTFRFEWDGGDSSCVAILFAETTGSIY